MTFTSAANSNYNTSVVVPCNGATTPFAWNAQLYPSTYSVSVRGGLSNLPSWSAMNSNYNTSVVVPCNGGSTPFAWTAQLYPSTYSVAVRGGLSNLPSWSVVVVDALEVR